MGLLDEFKPEEIEERNSVERFLTEIIYPKLAPKKKKSINGYLNKGLSVVAAFELSGIDISVCKR